MDERESRSADTGEATERAFAFKSEQLFRPSTSDRKFVATLAKGMDLLSAFQTRIGPLSNKALVTLTGFPKATVTRITYTLVQTGYLRKRDDGKFELSPRVVSLGYPVLVSQRIRYFAHDYMVEIAALGNYTLGLAVNDARSMVYIDECTGKSINKLRLDIGARIETVRSSIGRAYLSALTEEQRSDFYSRFAPAYGNEWPELLKRIEFSIREISELGFCLVDREWRKDTRSVAVPILSQDGKTLMALNCATPVFSASNQTMLEDIGPRLVHATRNWGLLMGE